MKRFIVVLIVVTVMFSTPVAAQQQGNQPGFVDGIISGIGDFVGGIFDGIGSIIGGIGDFLGGIFGGVASAGADEQNATNNTNTSLTNIGTGAGISSGNVIVVLSVVTVALLYLRVSRQEDEWE